MLYNKKDYRIFKCPVLFDITYDYNTSIVTIVNTDNQKWQSGFFITLYYSYKYYEIYIEPCNVSVLHKRVNLTKQTFIISLSTIPSRAKTEKFLIYLNRLANEQTIQPEQIILNIPSKYKRFNDTIDTNVQRDIQNISKNIKINIVDIDYGPACKYLGPSINNLYKDSVLIIVDDDRLYDKNLVYNYSIGVRSFPTYTFIAGDWSLYFKKEYNTNDINKPNIVSMRTQQYSDLPEPWYRGIGVAGFFGFAINQQIINNSLVEFTFKVLSKLPEAFIHDDGILLAYIKLKKEKVLYIEHASCNFITRNEEAVDALILSQPNTFNQRRKIENNILTIGKHFIS